MDAADTLFGQLATHASLCGPIGRQMVTRPSLHAVAAQVCAQQWQVRGIKGPAPSALTLVRGRPGQGARLDTLADALIRRYCERTCLNLASGLDYLTLQRGAEYPQAADVDLHAVETLLNECGPLLLDEYKRVLSRYWGQAEPGQTARWDWLADYLKSRFSSACELARGAGVLDGLELATATMVGIYPRATQRAQFGNGADVRVSLLCLDAEPGGGLDPELASAVLIERQVLGQLRTVVVLYTLAGGLYRFDSRQALLEALARGWGAQASGTFKLNLYQTELSIFQAQARLLFEQQLRLIDAIAAAPLDSQVDPVQTLVARLDEATSLVQVCDVSERQTLASLRGLLPTWLRDADEAPRLQYTEMLVRLARAQQRSGGQSFLHDLPGMPEYAWAQWQAAVHAGHPGFTRAELEDVELVNRQVIAGAGGSGGDFAPAGSIREVTLNLAQLAVGNLGLLRAGSVTLRSRSGAVLPTWLDLAFIKAQVTRLDVGQTYPDLLQHSLLDDPVQSASRQQLFVDQLREQLPMLVLEYCLRQREGVSALSARRVTALCRGEETDAVLRPLGLLREAGAHPDVALNAYLVEGRDPRQGPCLLYRPLHREPLQEFSSRQALFERLCEPGALHDDLLARLPAKAQPVYARGGLEQPHTVRFLPGSDFAPLQVPAPASFSDALIDGDPLVHLYRSCAQELVARARAGSQSSSEQRWAAYAELGWLMFNTLLPLCNGPVAVAGWLVQLTAGLRDTLQQHQSEGDGQLAGWLFNLALTLLASRTDTTRLKLSTPAQRGESPLAQVLEPEFGHALASPSGQALDSLDFSWAAAADRLNGEQRARLVPLQRVQGREGLGAPISHGPWQGLYLHEDRLWVGVSGQVYPVVEEDAGLRIRDAQQPPGPWLRHAADGSWQFDLGLRLRGGMPLNRRIQQLRLANQARVEVLQKELDDYQPVRQASALQLKRDLDEVVKQEPQPSAERLRRYVDDLRRHGQGLAKARESHAQLNQLKTLANFRAQQGNYLFEESSITVQLLYALRSLFMHNKDGINNLRGGQGQDRLRELVLEGTSPTYRQLVVLLEGAKTLTEQIIDCYQALDRLTGQLRQILPGGPAQASRIEAMRGEELSVQAWRSSQINMLGVLVLQADRGHAGGEGIYETVLSARLGLQLELEMGGAFTDQERVQMLDSSVRHYASALQGTQLYKASSAVLQGAAQVEEYQQVLQALHDAAQKRLAGLIRDLPRQPSAPPASGSRSRTLIRTRNRGVVVGQQRRLAGADSDVVVVIDPVEQRELARYEETAEAGIWQPVERPRPAPARATQAQLPRLLERSTRLLNDSAQQLRRAVAQARTAMLPVEMEEILTHQARPLDELARQIEQALTAGNDTDRSAAGQDAALQAKALLEQAKHLRDEGRRLRVQMTLAQLPTVSRVAYLKAQGEVSLHRLQPRKPTRKRKGHAQDFLQEYEIHDKAGQLLWVAHFHYATLDAEPGLYTAAHLKTAAQRFEGGQYQLPADADNERVIQIYRSQIDSRSARALFLDL